MWVSMLDDELVPAIYDICIICICIYEKDLYGTRQEVESPCQRIQNNLKCIK